MDNRKALGDGNSSQITEGDSMFPELADSWVDPYKNRLPGPYPSDRAMDKKPEIPYSGTPNPAICSTRPIADMNPNLGSGDIKEGTAFRVNMGIPGYNDSDYN
jgi:hypothetical protein